MKSTFSSIFHSDSESIWISIFRGSFLGKFHFWWFYGSGGERNEKESNALLRWVPFSHSPLFSFRVVCFLRVRQTWLGVPETSSNCVKRQMPNWCKPYKVWNEGVEESERENLCFCTASKRMKRRSGNVSFVYVFEFLSLDPARLLDDIIKFCQVNICSEEGERGLACCGSDYIRGLSASFMAPDSTH